jgi:exopolyphosphatase/guanosine-5'-triphosphate,3'-diphosphate pyrophosphatase
MKIAAIDVGTNTVLLLLAEAQPDGSLIPLLHAQRFPRLGTGIDAQGTISPDAIARLIEVLTEYRILLAPHRPDSVVVCGTSAVREALNQAALIRRVRTETGFTLEVLSGEDEARWTFRGALSGLREIERATVVDIGGGSTEIITGAPDRIERSISLQTGSVRLKERHLLHDPPTHPELEAAITDTEEALALASSFPSEGSTLVGVAGTATSLALLARGAKEFDLRAVSGYHMPYFTVDHLFRTLRSMPSAMILELSSVMEGRADVITAGALILRELMAHLGFSEVVVSERGVRYGLVLREAETAR